MPPRRSPFGRGPSRPDADILALCEVGAAFPSSACGANEAVEIPFCEDDCVQAQRIADALVQLKPDAVLFPATVRGRFLSAWAAAKLDTGLTADCTDLGLTPSGLLKQIRPAFGGNLTAEILCRSHRPQMASRAGPGCSNILPRRRMQPGCRCGI